MMGTLLQCRDGIVSSDGTLLQCRDGIVSSDGNTVAL